jgi:arginase
MLNRAIRNHVILFPHKLGQQLNGVQNTPHKLKKFFYEPLKKVNCINSISNYDNFSYNLHNLYKADIRVHNKYPFSYYNGYSTKHGKRSLLHRTINIGGDHSMSIASVAASLNVYPNVKVLWFDAHADINTRHSSITKNIHGMPLSFVTGLEKKGYSYFKYIKNHLPFKNILYIGIRDTDEYEKEVIKHNNIKYITSSKINSDPIGVVNDILAFIGSSPVHLSFDVDCIDPAFVKSTGTPVENGIHYTAAKYVIERLRDTNIVNMDITELNMELGTDDDIKRSLDYTFSIFETYGFIQRSFYNNVLLH